MGRLLYWMNVSLDLFIEGTEGENGGGDWLRIGEELHREFNRRAANLAVAIQGRVVHEIMEGAWPAYANDESVPDYMQEYGRIWLETPKILVSRTRTTADYNTTVIGGDDAIAQIGHIRATTDGDIGVGGATLATQLLRAGFLDEILLFTHPVVLGSGRPLFDEVDVPIQLDLLEHAEFEMGVTMHHYAIRSG